jgi:hypothetical protein
MNNDPLLHSSKIDFINISISHSATGFLTIGCGGVIRCIDVTTLGLIRTSRLFYFLIELFDDDRTQ